MWSYIKTNGPIGCIQLMISWKIENVSKSSFNFEKIQTSLVDSVKEDHNCCNIPFEGSRMLLTCILLLCNINFMDKCPVTYFQKSSDHIYTYQQVMCRLKQYQKPVNLWHLQKKWYNNKFMIMPDIRCPQHGDVPTFEIHSVSPCPLISKHINVPIIAKDQTLSKAWATRWKPDKGL